MSMNAERNFCSFHELLLLLLLSFFHYSASTIAIDYDLPTANLSTLWTNSGSTHNSVASNESSIRVVLNRRGTMINNGPTYVCGFYCNGHCLNYMFVIAIVMTDSGGSIIRETCPQVVWSANRNAPVKINTTLELTSGGDLVLRNYDGTVAWSTNTSGKSVTGMNLTEQGNLVLFDNNSVIVWQSFDFPTDALVPGQRLKLRQKLTASVSSTNWTESPLLSFTMTPEGLVGLMETDPPQIFSKHTFTKSVTNREDTNYVEYLNGSLSLFLNSKPDSTVIPVPSARSVQYMRLFSDGHLRVIEWSSGSNKWARIGDLLTGYLGRCGYPRVCGDYGICTNGQCTCPEPSDGKIYFRPLDDRKPDLGCSKITPLSCGDRGFIELTDVFHFATDFDVGLDHVGSESCTRECARNCSCKAAVFQYVGSVSDSSCYLLSRVFSLMNNDHRATRRNSTVYLKVHKTKVGDLSSHGRKITDRGRVILASSFAAFFGLTLLIGIGLLIWNTKSGSDLSEEDRLDQVLGTMPARFSYDELKSATSNFTTKLGEGGFGSVFDGVLIDGTKVAVKQLKGLGRIKESFLAEVETIGSIHHFNLVRLVGFCAEKSHRLLVYEYMANGSLDRLLFCRKNDDFVLGWRQRKKIILDVAKGLHYLHEDCRQKIIHMDIKPQNILLDDNFTAKLSDFGLSKLIDKHESQIRVDLTTTMRGTPGYLAPECLNAVISEKIDVYSFGVVLLEIVCGRKVLDISLCEEYMHLVGLFKRKITDGKLLDLVDKYSDDMQLHVDEVMDMMRIAAWCLQGDLTKRPSISMVVKVLDGSVDVKLELDPNLINLPWLEVEAAAVETGYGKGELVSGFQQIPYVLSGPR